MRTERDSMGEMAVPETALYGASTQRAVLNFPISGHPLPAPFLHALGLVKLACARANEELGLLSAAKSALVQKVAREIADGRHDAQFPIDVFQTGSATSTNMNANEVIAHRAVQLADGAGAKTPLHPNDDVNLGQSSNDVIPTTLHVSIAIALQTKLAPALGALTAALEDKARAFDDIVKIGRTHLMDATPLTLGQEFSGYAMQARKAGERVERAIAALAELAIGGTAVGTGLNCHPDFARRVCAILSAETGISFREARNHFEAQGGRDDCVEVAGQLAAVATAMTKIANDIRLLGSGPRAGLAELRLPATQPGSSIMPGKVNPVMSEMLVQVGLYTHGLTQTVVQCGRDGHFELNVTLPLIAHCLHEAIHCLANAVRVFTERCVVGLEADEARCRELVGRSLMLVTALNPFIGYDQAAAVAKEAFATGRTLREIVLEKKLLDAATLDRALDPRSMTKPAAKSHA
ncbi:class II fumarate hydratase [Horticoccus luteus]|uniref:Fumarate hydratase class II n=1 Tax=Horticoccus luteus TaxID=2862869 RepID=A0A8F9TWH2_9BACT|nr:class II fumarate hydratase [Horticoccus luteus]QYM79573.1 class II fumarate hydratase [Horticoccus luteus]